MSVASLVSEFFSSKPRASYDKGTILITPDIKVSTVFYIETGTVIQYQISDSGNKVILNTFKPGAFFPMSYIINDTPSPFFFEANSKINARTCTASAAVSFLRQNPDVMFDLLARMYRGVDALLLRQFQLMAGSASDRLIQELILSATRFGTKQKDQIFLKTTTEQLAQQTGLARETISREISKLKASGSLESTRGGLIIKLSELFNYRNG